MLHHTKEETTMRLMHKATLTAAAAILAAGLASGVGFAASQFEGTWKVQDTKGNPFEITLNQDGSAKGTRAGEGMTGKWKQEGSGVVISWDSGWTTQITEQGGHYTKTAFENGKPVGGGTPAEKVE
jgi:hypothetical protein